MPVLPNIPGIASYNYYQELKRKAAQAAAGVNLSPKPQSALSKLCIGNFDTSVSVGGEQGLPINSGGVSQYQIGGTFYPAPTFATVSTNVVVQNGLACEISAHVEFTNVPQDGAVARILWVFRETSGSGNWTTWAETTLQGAPFPPINQFNDFTYGGISNGLNYDLGACYVSLGGLVGTIGIFESGVSASAIGIIGSYLIDGVPVTPTISAHSLTPTGLVANVTQSVAITFTTSNQPVDGTLSRIGIWLRQTGATNWTGYSNFDAIQGSTSEAYTGIEITDLTNGVGYEFGITYISKLGAESNVLSLGTISAASLNIGTDYLRSGAGTAPTITGLTSNIDPGVSGMTSDLQVNLSVTNQPTDGSCAGLVWFLQTVGSPLAATPYAVSGRTSGAYSFVFSGLNNGVSYNVGIAFAYTNGTYGSILGFGAFTPQLLAIKAYQMANGGTPTPSISGVSLSGTTSVNGVTASENVAFTITNQPTDGSLSRVSIFFCIHGGTPAFYMSVPAIGVGSSTPPSSGAYSVVLADLALANQYDIFVKMEDTQGGESNISGNLGPTATTSLSLPLTVAATNINYGNGGAWTNVTPFATWNQLIDPAIPANSLSVGVVLPAGGNWQVTITFSGTGINVGARINLGGPGGGTVTSSQINPVFATTSDPNGNLTCTSSFLCPGGQSMFFALNGFFRYINSTLSQINALPNLSVVAVKV